MTRSIKGIPVEIVNDGDELVLMYGETEVCRGKDTRDFGQRVLNPAITKALNDDIPGVEEPLKRKKAKANDGN